MNIKEIKIDKFPLVIITDPHGCYEKVSKVLSLYPEHQIICLGDVVDLFNKNKNDSNHKIIDLFIDKKIPCILGNHEQHVLSCSDGNTLRSVKLFGDFGGGTLTDIDEYDLGQRHIDFLRVLPLGLKLVLPNGHYYYAFHNLPNDLWGQEWNITKDDFIRHYPINCFVDGILRGHHHKNQVLEFQGISTKLYGIGALKFGDYALLNENGIEFKKL